MCAERQLSQLFTVLLYFLSNKPCPKGYFACKLFLVHLFIISIQNCIKQYSKITEFVRTKTAYYGLFSCMYRTYDTIVKYSNYMDVIIWMSTLAGNEIVLFVFKTRLRVHRRASCSVRLY